MGIIDEIISMAKDNNGMITTAMIVKAGYHKGNLKYLVDKGRLERVARGVYTLPEVWEDEFLSLQNRFKKGIFSCETALFLWNLTDRTPNYYYMTFPSTYNITKPKAENIRCLQTKEPFYSMGIVKIKSPGGNLIAVYNMEHTLCDILKPKNNVDIQLITDAFKRYAKRPDKNIPLLSEYAKMMRVEKRLRAYLEVLL